MHLLESSVNHLRHQLCSFLGCPRSIGVLGPARATVITLLLLGPRGTGFLRGGGFQSGCGAGRRWGGIWFHFV